MTARKPITQNSLARQLQPFNLVPGNLRVHGQVIKGYRLEQFHDAFARYIPTPPFKPLHRYKPQKHRGFSPIANRYTKNVAVRTATRKTVAVGVAVQKTPQIRREPPFVAV
jgi:Protein of unknown function (DUF3631)